MQVTERLKLTSLNMTVSANSSTANGNAALVSVRRSPNLPAAVKGNIVSINNVSVG